MPAGARESRGGRRMVGLDRERELERLARGARLRAGERLLAALHGIRQRLGPALLERREALRAPRPTAPPLRA